MDLRKVGKKAFEQAVENAIADTSRWMLPAIGLAVLFLLGLQMPWNWYTAKDVKAPVAVETASQEPPRIVERHIEVRPAPTESKEKPSPFEKGWQGESGPRPRTGQHTLELLDSDLKSAAR